MSDAPATVIYLNLTEGDIDETIECHAGDDLRIDLGDLDHELQNNPGWYSHYAVLSARAYAHRETETNKLKALYARLALQYRRKGIEGIPKLSEDTVKSAVLATKLYQTQQQKVVQAVMQYQMILDAKESFADRRHMLIQLSANNRKEREEQG